MGCKQSQPDAAYAPGVPPQSFTGVGPVDAVAEKNIRKAYDTGHLTHEEIHERIDQGVCQHSIKVVSSESLNLDIAWVSQRGFYPDDLDKDNQDSFLIDLEFNGEVTKALLGVFDGHGKVGELCSRFARDRIGSSISSNPQYATKFREAYKDSFVATNTLMHKQRNSNDGGFDDSMSGTTAITVFIDGNTVHVANVGDSRAIMCCEDEGGKKSFFALSLDQTPFRKDERERCKKAGARVLTMDQIDGFKDPNLDDWGTEEDDDGDPPRLWLPNKRYPGTAFTRSLGDAVAESIGVTAEPEILTKRLTANDKYLIIASDGVFEFLSNENVLEIANNFQDPSVIARTLVAESYSLWLQYEVRTDDITCIVVKINGLSEVVTDIQGTISSSFLDVMNNSGVPVSLKQSARPVRRVVAKAKRLEINAGDRSKLTDEELRYVPPDSFSGTADEKRRIEEAVKANFLFQHLNTKQREGVFNSMSKVVVKKDDIVIKQGDVGDRFYIVDQGQFDVIVTPKANSSGEVSVPIVVHTYNVKGDNYASFGELSLMYDKPRAATVRAKTDGVLWALDRVAFRATLLKSKSGEMIKTLSKVGVLSTLERNHLTRLADLLSEVTYNQGDVIIRQGDIGDTFYVVTSGDVSVTKDGEEVMKLGANSYFGERALLSGDRRAANVTAVSAKVVCYQIGRSAFEEVLGPLQLLIDADRIRREAFADNKSRMTKLQSTLGISSRVPNGTSCNALATVFVSDSGHINLVADSESKALYSQFAFSKNSIFADKKTNQIRDNLHRALKLSQTSRYIPSLVNFHSDSGSLNLVYKESIVAALTDLTSGEKLGGGDLRVFVCMILSALESIHSKQITFRGMSSEKIMVDKDGFPLLGDFRIAKDSLGRSFTICGTPDYLAPEVITNKGADYLADLWSVGVLMFELQTGVVPFSTEKTTEFQLFEKISNYKYETLTITGADDALCDVINGFLQPDPSKRLGFGGASTDYDSIKKMPLFEDVDWEAIKSGSIKSPLGEKASAMLAGIMEGNTVVSDSHPDFTIDDTLWFSEW